MLRTSGTLPPCSRDEAIPALACAVALIAFGCSARVAWGQACGDADGNGQVTVTDGVQVLRAAAGLTSDVSGGRETRLGSSNLSIQIGAIAVRRFGPVLRSETRVR